MCTSDGTWYRRGDSGSATEKTNYSPCSPVVTLRQRTNVHLIAYTVSVAMLIPALFVFYSYKYCYLIYFLFHLLRWRLHSKKGKVYVRRFAKLKRMFEISFFLEFTHI